MFNETLQSFVFFNRFSIRLVVLNCDAPLSHQDVWCNIGAFIFIILLFVITRCYGCLESWGPLVGTCGGEVCCYCFSLDLGSVCLSLSPRLA